MTLDDTSSGPPSAARAEDGQPRSLLEEFLARHDPEVVRRTRAEVASIMAMSRDDLRLKWRHVFRRTAPRHLSRNLLMRVLAYRVQADAYGDLDQETKRMLDRIARRLEKEKRSARNSDRPSMPRFRPGTELVREWEGAQHRVTILVDGFGWKGKTFNSLSAVAKAITGTHWNGHRFFGLRAGPTRAGDAHG